VSAEYGIGTHRGRFILRYRDGERWVRISLGTSDRGLAEARAGDIWRARNTPVSERIADLWPAYVKERKAAGAKSDRWNATWKALSPHFGHRLGNKITRQDCHDYYEARKRAGIADSTVRNEFSFSPATSLFVECTSRERMRVLVERLSDGGKVFMPLDNYGFSKLFAWVADRFGVSWQLNMG
jgi:hypothetical protein